MRSKKRYTNATFTKRVDHDGGRHREPRSAPEPGVCTSCGAVLSHARWNASEEATSKLLQDRSHEAHLMLCPACRQKQKGVPGGFVNLHGAFVAAHLREIEALLRNEAERAAEDNPLARILEWEWGNGKGLTVTTTTEHLAQRLGHALEKAYGGTISYVFSHENKLTRVRWHRG